MAEEGLLDRSKSYEEQTRYKVQIKINGKSGTFLPLKERIKPYDEDIEVLGTTPIVRKPPTVEENQKSIERPKGSF